MIKIHSVILLFAIVSAPGILLAETRAAFVVGNSEYENAPSLSNPARDARLVGDTLSSLGFEVTRHQDLTRESFAKAFGAFLKKSRDADVTFFYFAGHGMQYDGQNYLVGTDAELISELDIEGETIALNKVVELLERNSKAALIFVDACRDNPLATDFYRRNFSETRALNTRGLARVRSRIDGSMLVFAAGPGQVAYDGDGRNSPFATALATHLPTEGKEILTLTKRIIGDVRDATDGRQSPIVTNDLTKEIFLREAALRPKEDDADAALPMVLPNICEGDESATEALICRDPELISLHIEVDELFDNQLGTTGGAARGQALMEQREWRLARDACGADRACIARFYQLRRISLLEFGSGRVPKALVIRGVQEELNRLSCGAGEADGVAGAQTRRAYSLAASLRSDLLADAPLDEIGTLASLRELVGGICSAIRRGGANPKLIEGIWSVSHSCPNQNVSKERFTLTLRHDGDGVYSGSISRGGWVRALGGRLTLDALSLAHRTEMGNLQSFMFSASSSPFELKGIDWNRCELVARKR